MRVIFLLGFVHISCNITVLRSVGTLLEFTGPERTFLVVPSPVWLLDPLSLSSSLWDCSVGVLESSSSALFPSVWGFRSRNGGEKQKRWSEWWWGRSAECAVGSSLSLLCFIYAFKWNLSAHSEREDFSADGDDCCVGSDLGLARAVGEGGQQREEMTWRRSFNPDLQDRYVRCHARGHARRKMLSLWGCSFIAQGI